MCGNSAVLSEGCENLPETVNTINMTRSDFMSADEHNMDL